MWRFFFLGVGGGTVERAQITWLGLGRFEVPTGLSGRLTDTISRFIPNLILLP